MIHTSHSSPVTTLFGLPDADALLRIVQGPVVNRKRVADTVVPVWADTLPANRRHAMVRQSFFIIISTKPTD